MRTKLTYSVTKKAEWELDNEENKITGRYGVIEIYGKTREEAIENFESFETYLAQCSSLKVSSYPDIEEVKTNVWCYTEYIAIDSKDRFEDLKYFYMNWKASLKSAKTITTEKVESSNSDETKLLKKDIVKMISGNIYSIRANGGKAKTNWKLRSLYKKYNCISYDSYDLIEQILMRKTKNMLNEIYKVTNDFLKTMISIVAEQSETISEQSSTVENTDITPVSENAVQVTEPQQTCNDVQKTPNTPSYRIYQSTIDLKGTTLQVGQKYRIDLLNGTNVSEVTELNNLIWNEFTTGHKDGNDTIMYIEITRQKTTCKNSQLCNNNDKKLQGENKNVYIDSDNELVIERINSTYGKIYNELHSRVKHIKRALKNNLNNNFITQTEYNQCIALL